MKKIKINKLITFVTLISVFTALVGCVTNPAKYQAMMVKPTAAIPQNKKLEGTIVVDNVFGGKKTSWNSQVENEEFKKALEGSLSAYGYLANNSPKYHLEANLLKLKQPLLGFNLEVNSEVLYKMTGNGIKKQYLIKASGLAKFSDVFVADERLKIANERSIQKNIRQFLSKLSSF